jgi:hypothetical protein
VLHEAWCGVAALWKYWKAAVPRSGLSVRLVDVPATGHSFRRRRQATRSPATGASMRIAQSGDVS